MVQMCAKVFECLKFCTGLQQRANSLPTSPIDSALHDGRHALGQAAGHHGKRGGAQGAGACRPCSSALPQHGPGATWRQTALTSRPRGGKFIAYFDCLGAMHASHTGGGLRRSCVLGASLPSVRGRACMGMHTFLLATVASAQLLACQMNAPLHHTSGCRLQHSSKELTRDKFVRYGCVGAKVSRTVAASSCAASGPTLKQLSHEWVLMHGGHCSPLLRRCDPDLHLHLQHASPSAGR